VLLVQNLVVLEVVQERRGGGGRIAGEEHGGTRNDVRRLALHAVHERFTRDLGAPGLGRQKVGSAPPRDDQQHHGDAEQQRHPGAFQELEQIGGEENAVDRHQRDDQQRGLPPRPSPQPPDDDEAKQSVHHHGGAHRDAIGGG